SDEILGGYPPFRRDMLLHDSAGQDAATVERLVAELQRANPVSRGLLLPEGGSLPLDALRPSLGFAPSWIEADRSAALQPPPLLPRLRRRDGGPRSVPRPARRPRRPGAARRPAARAPGALSLGENPPPELRPRHARRPHGDGTLGRGPRPVPRPPRRRARARP